MKRDPLDARAAQVFRDHQAAPPPAAWAAIAARLPAEKRRRLWPLLWCIGVLLGAGLLTTFYATNTASTQSPVPQTAFGSTTILDRPAPTASAESLARRTAFGNSNSLKKPAPTTSTDSRSSQTDLSTRRNGSRRAGFGESRKPSDERREAGEAITSAARGHTPFAIEKTILAGAEPGSLGEAGSLREPGSLLDIRPLHALQISPDLHDIPCPDFGHASSWSLGLRVLAGIGQPGRAWESVEGERVEYLAHRDSSEQLRFHPTAGLRLEAYHPSGFFVRAGLDYLMERSQVSSQGPTTTTKNIVEVRDPISERVIRVDTTTTITYTQLTTQNRQHRLALVGGLGYRLPGFRLRPYVVAEVGYGLLLHSRGRLPRPGIDSEELSLVSPYLRRSPGLQFGGIVGVDLPVDAHWAIGLNVHYTRLGTIRGAGDPLNYSQLTRGAALNLVYRPQ